MMKRSLMERNIKAFKKTCNLMINDVIDADEPPKKV